MDIFHVHPVLYKASNRVIRYYAEVVGHLNTIIIYYENYKTFNAISQAAALNLINLATHKHFLMTLVFQLDVQGTIHILLKLNS